MDEDLLLVSPVHPVTEGASVTLSCRLRGENNISDVIFYHHDKLIQNDSRGELKISAVSQSDEGFYKCEHSGEVSPQSWMAVKDVSRHGSSSFPVLLVVGPACGVVLIVVLLLLCCFIKRKGASDLHVSVRPSEDPVDDANDDQHVTYSLLEFKNSGNKSRHCTPEEGAIYSNVGAGAAGLVSRNGRSSPAAADAVVYSEVKSTSGY
ncbi:PREDICTED: uncharacterized protein LOC106909885 [Poecilia mexicana]|uniref:uncharacterized protein LOC106909885 n=1 Tax=Poecilia mexicana TaxID=48701 RepID=UPI00072DF7B1|nr:PREDICTED: uncharacterized protein LOC106909885 [Poecilia mexicana]